MNESGAVRWVDYLILCLTLALMLTLSRLYEDVAVVQTPGQTFPPIPSEERGEFRRGDRRTLFDLNAMSVEELCQLEGIGEALAGRIAAYREEHGPFRSVEELLEVSGIGEKKLAAIRPYVYVDAD